MLSEVRNSLSSVHNNRPDTAVLDKTIQEAYLIDVDILSTIIKKTWNKAYQNMATENDLHNNISTIHNRYYSKQVKRNF